MTGASITGRLVSGIGQGRHFTRLDWARRQFIDRLGIDPYPGTINLRIDDARSRSAWDQLKAMPGVRIDNPNEGPHACDARCYRVMIGDRFEAAIVLPEVEGYAPEVIELICGVGLRTALGIEDGAEITLTVR